MLAIVTSRGRFRQVDYRAVKTKPMAKPVWWKNTYFWIAGILFIVGVIGLPFLGGNKAIRDPGQIPEEGIFLIYWGGAAIMLVNGIISHKMTVQHYQEEKGEEV
jgi:hypothetical protein